MDLYICGQALPGKHASALLFVSFSSISIAGFAGIAQPFILTEILHIPFDQQGSITGNLLVLHELVNLVLIGFYGAASDKLGRRPVLAGALLILAVGYCLFPLVKGQAELVMFRLVVASGAAGVSAMVSAVTNDYPLEKSRARFIALVFIFNGLGLATLPGVFGNLPSSFTAQGIDASTAAIYTFLIVAGAATFVALVAGLGLRPGAPAQLSKREPLLSTFHIGIREAKRPRIALAYAAAMVSRGDLAVISTFLTLWLVSEGVKQGLSTADALGQATLFYVIIQASALPWAGVLGFLLDRMDRVVGVILAMIFAAAGYGSFLLLDNPLSNWMYACAVFVGLGEMAAVLSATSLIGQEAPEQGRGAVMGVFGMFGALGIMSIGIFGGYLFDNWQPVGPFLLMTVTNLGLLIGACLVLFWERRKQH